MTYQQEISLTSKGHGDMHDLTGEVASAVRSSSIQTGVVHVFNVGSTAGIGTIEFEPGLERDLPAILDKRSPPSRAYGHEQAWHDGNGHSYLATRSLRALPGRSETSLLRRPGSRLNRSTLAGAVGSIAAFRPLREQDPAPLHPPIERTRQPARLDGRPTRPAWMGAGTWFRLPRQHMHGSGGREEVEEHARGRLMFRHFFAHRFQHLRSWGVVCGTRKCEPHRHGFRPPAHNCVHSDPVRQIGAWAMCVIVLMPEEDQPRVNSTQVSD